jgi:signal transduction histidine kinase
LEFEFTALSFTAPENVNFRYRLEGFDADWVAAGTDRHATYSRLAAGGYRFQVTACNNDGIWNEAGAAFAFTVAPFIWQTWWFRALSGTAVVGLLAAAYSIRIARLRQLERLRLRIARDLHDEVGANLGSISLLAQVMEKQPLAADAALIRSIAVQTTDTLRDIVWFIDPKHDYLSDLVARLREASRMMLQGVPHQFEQEGEFGAHALPLGFRRNVLSIFKEALHNVAKHSGATKVEVRVSRSASSFELRVADNGVGFLPATAPRGNGLQNMRRRAADLGGKLEIETRIEEGTTLTFTAPLPQMRD